MESGEPLAPTTGATLIEDAIKAIAMQGGQARFLLDVLEALNCAIET
jgi:hypothetical protein